MERIEKKSSEQTSEHQRFKVKAAESRKKTNELTKNKLSYTK